MSKAVCKFTVRCYILIFFLVLFIVQHWSVPHCSPRWILGGDINVAQFLATTVVESLIWASWIKLKAPIAVLPRMLVGSCKFIFRVFNSVQLKQAIWKQRRNWWRLFSILKRKNVTHAINFTNPFKLNQFLFNPLNLPWIKLVKYSGNITWASLTHLSKITSV